LRNKLGQLGDPTAAARTTHLEASFLRPPGIARELMAPQPSVGDTPSRPRLDRDLVGTDRGRPPSLGTRAELVHVCSMAIAVSTGLIVRRTAMPDATNQAQDAVAESSGSYGGPASEEQLAEVYLPQGEQQAKGGSPSSDSTSSNSTSSNSTVRESGSDPGAPDEEASAPE